MRFNVQRAQERLDKAGMALEIGTCGVDTSRLEVRADQLPGIRPAVQLRVYRQKENIPRPRDEAKGENTMASVKLIHHVNVQISHRQRTREWYEQVLGAEFLDRGPLNERQLQLRIVEGYGIINLRVDDHVDPMEALWRVFNKMQPLIPYYKERPDNPEIGRVYDWARERGLEL